MVAVNIGYGSIYAFLPLYAIASGLDGNLGWFYALFSACIIGGRLALRGLSDRIGWVRALVPAIASTALGYLVLALPPRVPPLAAGAWAPGAGHALGAGRASPRGAPRPPAPGKNGRRPPRA